MSRLDYPLGLEEPQSYTYSELTTLVNNAQLVTGQTYILSDFYTKASTNISFGKISEGDTIDVTPEQLILTAISSTEFSPEAKSLTYQQDIIRYKFLPDLPYTGPGYIIYREDTERNISMYQDWRNIWFRLYEEALGSGVYVSFTDTGFGYQDFKSFDLTKQVENISVGKKAGLGAGTIARIIFQDTVTKVILGDQMDPLVIVGTVQDIISESCSQVTITGSVYAVVIRNEAKIRVNGDVTLTNFSAISNEIFNGDLDTCDITEGDSDGAGFGLDHSHEGLGAGKLWSITFAALEALVTSNVLIVEQLYKITDRNNAVVRAVSTSSYIPERDCIGRMDWDYAANMATASYFDGSVVQGPYDLKYCNEVWVMGDGGTLSTNTINNPPSWPVKFRGVEDGGGGYNVFTLSGIAFAAITQNGQFMNSADVVLDSEKGDYAILEPISITNGAGTFTVWKLNETGIY